MGNNKDIVFNLTNGNVSYVILPFILFLRIREKVIAIPLGALKLDIEE